MGVADLIARVQRATGPDRELDMQIHAYLNRHDGFRLRESGYSHSGGHVLKVAVLPYTGSLDAAATLMPSLEMPWGVGRDEDGKPGADLPRYGKLLNAATLPLVMCLAALMARGLGGVR